MEWGAASDGDIQGVTAGDGLSGGGTSGTPSLALDLNELTAAVVNVANDSIAIIDADGSNGSKKEAIADLITAIAGAGLAAASGVLALDLHELAAATVNVANDSIAIIDGDDNSSKKESITDLVSGMAGSGLTATNGVLATSGGISLGLALALG